VDRPNSASPQSLPTGHPEPTASLPQRDSSSPTPVWRRLESWNLLFTIITVILLTVYTYYTRMQAAALIRSVDAQVRSTVAHDRPWVVVAEVTSAPKNLVPRVPTPFVWRIKNVGALPALHLSIRSNWCASPRGLPDPPIFAGIASLPENSVTVIGPGESCGHPSMIGPLREDVLDRIESGHDRLYVYGDAEYQGPDGSAHTLQFCQLFNPKARVWSSCSQYNSLD